MISPGAAGIDGILGEIDGLCLGDEAVVCPGDFRRGRSLAFQQRQQCGNDRIGKNAVHDGIHALGHLFLREMFTGEQLV